MTVQFASVGTNYETYSNNFDRNGGWSNYLNNLSLLNNHDRQRYNGEFNTVSGMREISFGYPVYKENAVKNKTGHPMTKDYIKNVNFKVDTDTSKSKRERIKRTSAKGYNPNYLGAHGV